MSTEQIAYLALIVSIVALIINFVSLYRDKHVIQARRSLYTDSVESGIWNVSISVSNSGKRPITICFITVRIKGGSGVSVPFSNSGPVSIDVGEVATANIEGGKGAGVWHSLEELKECEIFVEDALGEKHPV